MLYNVPTGDETRLAQDRIWSLDDFVENQIEGKTYLAAFENIRFFRDAVLERAKALGFTGASDAELVAFLDDLCRQAGVGLERPTLKNWIMRSAPKAAGRENVYRLCFALRFNEAETATFFLKAYLERPFYFKNETEAVYYYCLKNRLPYSEAKRIISELADSESIRSELYEDHTQLIGLAISQLRNETALKRYILENRAGFAVRNKTAAEAIGELLESCMRKATEESRRFPYLYGGREINTIDSLLTVITGFQERGGSREERARSLSKSSFPKYISENFPQRQSFERILKNEASFDAVRKALLLLSFYDFFAGALLSGYTDGDLFDEFTDEANALLDECGFVQLYWRNPYDWMLGYCAGCAGPLDAFREIVNTFYLEDAED